MRGLGFGLDLTCKAVTKQFYGEKRTYVLGIL